MGLSGQGIDGVGIWVTEIILLRFAPPNHVDTEIMGHFGQPTGDTFVVDAVITVPQLQENILGHVFSVVHIAQRIQRVAVDAVFMALDEVCVYFAFHVMEIDAWADGRLHTEVKKEEMKAYDSAFSASGWLITTKTSPGKTD